MTQHNEMIVRLPDSQKTVGCALRFERFNQCLVAGKIACWIRQSKFDILHTLVDFGEVLLCAKI
jgi:hypothetical protein